MVYVCLIMTVCLFVVVSFKKRNATGCFQGDQVGIAARMFKALVGRGHPEFSTNRQQDAQEFLLHFINMVEVIPSLFIPSFPWSSICPPGRVCFQVLRPF